ncbi:MAG: YDG domain-containing protein, partial [Bacteroidales bacterium]
MNEKIILKNKSFTKMFSFLVVLVMLAFCSSSALAQIQVRLNLTPDKVYSGSVYGSLSWKNTAAKLVDISTGLEIPVGTCDVSGFNPASVICQYSDKNAGKNKSCEVTTNLNVFSAATLTNPAYTLISVTAYTATNSPNLYYDAVGAKLVSNKAEITHAYLTATYNVSTSIVKVYDGTTVLPSNLIEKSSITLSGYVNGESGCRVSEITNVYAPSKNVGSYSNQAVVNGINIVNDYTPSVAFNYKVNAFNVDAQILPSPISVKDNVIAINDKTYNGNNTATIDWTNTTAVSNNLFNGIFNGDVVDLNRTVGNATFSDAAVADSKSVAITNLSLAAVGDYQNYTLIPTTANSIGNIVPANLDVANISMAATLTYGQILSDITNPGYVQIDPSIQYQVEKYIYNGIDSNSYQPHVNGTGIQAKVYRLISGGSSVDPNYNSGIITVNLTVNPKSISVKDNAIAINDKTYNGNNAGIIDWSNTTHIVADLFNGVIVGDSIDLLRSGLYAVSREASYTPHANATFSDVNVGTSKDVDITNLSLETIGNYQDYTLSPNTANSVGNIVPANLDVANISMTATLTYGQILSDITNPVYVQIDPSIQYQVEKYIYNGVDSNSYHPYVGETGPIQAKVYRLLAGGSGIDSNYNSGIITVNLTVNPKSISVKDNAIAINDKTYNGNDEATIDWSNTTTTSTDLFTGIEDNDVVDLNRTVGNATFSDATVADSKNVNITNLSLATGGDNQNYTLSPTTANSIGNIIAANLDATLSMTATLPYGQSLSDITNPGYIQVNSSIQYQVDKYIYNGIDSNSYQPYVGETGTIQAKVYKLLAGVGSGIDPNYNFGIITVDLTVTPKTIVINGITADNKVYDGTDAATININNVTYNTLSNLSSVIVTRNGIDDDLTVDFSSLTTTFANANVGNSKDITISSVSPAVVTLGGEDKTNYTLSSYNTTSTANITKAPYVTMILKSDKPSLLAIDYPTNFAVTPVANDFDFNGFIGGDQATFIANFSSEDFRYRITQNGIYKSIMSPQPGTYDVVVNKATDTDSLRNDSTITIIDATNITTLANYEGIKFVVSERTQVVNSTPVTVIFPTNQNINEYGWQTKEIYTTTATNGEQVVINSYSDPAKIYAIAGTTGTDYITGIFKWVYPTSVPNVSASPGDTASYIFIPDVSYGGAYGDTIFGVHHLLLTKADLAIKIAPSTTSILVGQTVGDATITSPSGEVIHKNKGTTVYSSTINNTIGSWSYINPTEEINAVGNYSKNIQFTLTNALSLRNYNSPVTIDIANNPATASVAVSPAINNINPNGVKFEFPYGTKICVAQMMPTFDLNTFVLSGKEAAYPGTFKFIESTTSGYSTPIVNMDDNIILYRPTTSEDTTLWVTYTPNDTNYAPEQFPVKVKITPKELFYTAPNYNKVYDGIATFGFNTTNSNLIANQIIDRSGVYDDVTFDSLSYELDSKNVGTYTQANILAGTVVGRLTGANNYNYVLAPMPNQASVNITPANLYVNVVSDSISIRETIPTFEIKWDNFVSGENETNAIQDNGDIIYVVDGSNLTTGDRPNSIGIKSIIIPNTKYTANHGNYLINYSTLSSYNTLTVLPAQIMIVAQDRERVFGEETNPVYYFDTLPYLYNPLYYDFDVFEYDLAGNLIDTISEAEKNTMFLQTPTIICNANTYNRPAGTYIIDIASNTILRSSIYEIIDHVNGTLTIHKATPRVLTLPTVTANNFGGKLSDIVLNGGSVTHPYHSEFSTQGHFEWDTTTNFTITSGTHSLPVKYVADDSHNYNDAIINNQYNDSINGYYNFTTLSSDPLAGQNFRVNLTINKVRPVIIWPIAKILNYGQTLAEALPSHMDGSTYNPIDPTPTFNWTVALDTIPNAGTSVFEITYVPSDTNYLGISTNLPVYTNKTTPKLVDTAYVANYSFGQTLNAHNNFTASFYNTYNTTTIDGTLNWVNGTLTPVNGSSYAARFTPNDQANYNDKVISVKVVVDQTTPIVSWPLPSHLTYGQKLSDVNLMGGSAVNPNNNTISVAGNFVWETPNAQPIAGNALYNLIFVPTDVTMLNDTTSITINTVKATPVVTLNEVSTDTYGKTLANRPLSYSSVNNIVSHRSSVETIAVAGAIAWNNTSIIPTVANNDYVATFTPSDIANYNTVLINVNVPTTKATPIVSATVAAYSYGQTLPVNTPTLTSAVNPVNNSLVLSGGQLVWNSIDQLPVTGAYTATYYPTDVDNYTSA